MSGTITERSISRDQVKAAYNQLLGRDPEVEGLGEGADPFAFVMGVAISEEHRRRIVTQEVEKHRFSITDTATGAFVTYTADKVIGHSIRNAGGFEEQAINGAIQIAESSGVPVKRNVFVDVGANIGTHSIFAVNSGFKKAICVEADRNNYRLLRANQILHDVDAICINHLVAASDAEGEIEIQISPFNFGDHRVGHKNEAQSVHGEEAWEIQVIHTKPLDDIIRSSGVDFGDLGLVWIDTQGHEGQVLSGAHGILQADAPIVTEFWPYGLERSGGFRRFKELASKRTTIIDIRASQETGVPVKLTANELDAMYASMLSSESRGSSPHTDLLLLNV
ncbi:FkbM family methyltransferase [Agrobacterium tumefaciens]|uniref:FkbM family methyltransferase n=1 Tax=Agrobacterium tumefaciens TaxID=358 RepID=UPI000EF239AF|nr:hypothetical protein At1D1108_34270 [Agrobacterium tumefaciens]NSY94075.1 FkbM family methyltransferase [Agrobacterium tumefaciens]